MRSSARWWSLIAVLLVAAGTAAHGQPLKPNYASDQELSPNTTLSGLNLVPSVNGTGAFPGRVFDATGPDGVAKLLVNISDPAGWSDTITTQVLISSGGNASASGLSLPSAPGDRVLSKWLWVADTSGTTVYKIDTTQTGDAIVAGAYPSRPSVAAGNPVPFAVLSTGDAYVGNAFTFDVDYVGSLTKFQADNTTCGPGGSPTVPGTTSTGINALSWTSTTTGTSRLTLNGQVVTQEGLVGSLKDSSDACIKAWVDFSQVDAAANTVSIASIGADGFDRVYTLSLNEQVRFGAYLKIYRTNTDQSQELLLDNYQDPNQIVTRDGVGNVISAASDGPGAPGGSGLLVDQWGFLWSGGGTYIKDFGAGIGRQNILIRMDTEYPGNGLQFFPLAHESDTLAFNNDGNMWVAGASGLSLMQIDPGTIGASFNDGDIGPTILLTPGSTYVNLTAAQGDCHEDNCCKGGNYNTGLAVTRSTGDVFVANECPTGKVLHFDANGTQIGGGINIGTFPASINVDASDNIWVSTMVDTGPDLASAGSTALWVIPPGPSNAATNVSTIPKPLLGGTGDMTGRYTAVPPPTGQWQLVHDTNYNEYDKWSGALSRWAADNVMVPEALTVAAATSHHADGPWSASEYVLGNGGNYTTLSLPPGRYIRITATVSRNPKQAPVLGPQGIGSTPLLTGFELIPRNNYPTALCQDRSVDADNPVDQTDTTYGANSNGRICGAQLDNTTATDAGSYDPDTAELDSIAPVEMTPQFYSPTQYTLVSQAQPYTVSTLTVTDAHGGMNQCAAKINITDISPPAWKSQYNLANTSNPFSGALSDISQLCIWPPNLRYYCWLDVTSNDNDQVIPLYDNCGGSVPIVKHVDFFVCADSDPLSQAGDCVLYQDGSKYNLCVLAERRTAYTNSDRVYQVNFLVTDASTPTLQDGNWYSRQIRLPPLWTYQPAGDCLRPNYSSPTGSTLVYANEARKAAK